MHIKWIVTNMVSNSYNCFLPDVLSVFFHSTIIFLSSILVWRDTISAEHCYRIQTHRKRNVCSLIHFVNCILFEKQKRYYHRSSFVKKQGKDLQRFWWLFLKRVLKVHAYVFSFFQFTCIFIVHGRSHYKLNFQQYFNAFFKILLTATHRSISFETSPVAHSVKPAKYLSNLRACFQNLSA